MPPAGPRHPGTLAMVKKRQDDNSDTVGVHPGPSSTQIYSRAVWKKKASFDDDGKPSSPTPSVVADTSALKAQYDFYKYGIDKPILDSWRQKHRHSRVLSSVEEALTFLDKPSSTPAKNEDAVQGKAAIQEQARRFFFPANSREGFLKASAGDRATPRMEYHRWVIHPSSCLRHTWDFFVTILVVVVLIEVPLKLAFFPKLLEPPELLILDIFLDGVFAVDILLNFWTGYHDDEETVKTLRMKPQDIWRSYARSWFAVDLISTIPFDYAIAPLLELAVGLDVPPDGNAVKAVKILGILRALRFCRLYRYLPRLQNIFYAQEYMYVRVLNLAFLMVMVSHWNGCIHFLVDFYLGFPPKCWISVNDLQSAPWWEQWSWSLFNAVSQTFGIGFGRSTPDDLTDMWFTLWGMITGTSGYALILAHIATMWQHVDGSRKLHTQKMQEIDDYMTFRRFSSNLKSRIRDYFEERYQGRVFNEDKILNTLSDPLRERVMRHNCADTVRCVPFFAKTDAKFIEQLVTRLKFSFFQPEDVITKIGAVGSNMFFIQSGKVRVENENGKVLTTLTGEMYFGELSIIVPCKRNATVRAKTHCSLLELTSYDFHQVLDKFPSIERDMQSLAEEILSNPRRWSQVDEQDPATSSDSFLRLRYASQTQADIID